MTVWNKFITAAEMMFLRRILRKTKKDCIGNKVIRDHIRYSIFERKNRGTATKVVESRMEITRCLQDEMEAKHEGMCDAQDDFQRAP